MGRCYAAALKEDRKYSISAPFGYASHIASVLPSATHRAWQASQTDLNDRLQIKQSMWPYCNIYMAILSTMVHDSCPAYLALPCPVLPCPALPLPAKACAVVCI